MSSKAITEQLYGADRNRLGVLSIVLAAVLFLAFNMFVDLSLRSAQLDLTERKLYTLSDGTRRVLASLDEPVTLRLYFTRDLGDNYPTHAAYFTRIRELLERYVDLSRGKIRLEVYNPEPFSEVEDEAVTFGLQGVPFNQSGDKGYFGLAGSNALEGQQVIPFFTTEREKFLEYDLTKLVYNLSTVDKPVVGMLSRLPIEGGVMSGRRPQPAWAITNQIREFFEIHTLPAEISSVPDDVDVLMIVHPKGLSDETLYAIDQFVLKGGRALVFADPNPELDVPSPLNPPGPSDLGKLFSAWGLELVKDKVAGDLETARRVNVRDQGQLTAVDYVVWNTLVQKNMDSADAVVADIGSLNVGSAGILRPLKGATTKFHPLIRTGTESQAIDAKKLHGRIDVVGLFRDFKPSGKRFTLAARVVGPVKSAFGDKPPLIGTGEAAKKGQAKRAETHLGKSAKPINVIVVADTDMLHEGLWADTRNLMGEQLVIPYAGNADMVMNALENLSGGDALLDLRSRADARRPFTMVEQLQLASDRQYRAEKEKLVKKLTKTQDEMESLTSPNKAGGETILSAEDKQRIEDFRHQIIEIRRKLREVQHALRKDIDDLDAWLKFLNIAAIPLVLGLAALILALVRRFRRPRRPVEG